MKHNVDIAELQTMYAAGMTTRQIGMELNVPSKTIWRYLKNSGVIFRNPGVPTIEQLADREWLYQRYVVERNSSTEIGIEIGCSAHSVTLWLSRHGIEARGTGSEKGHARNTSDDCRQKMSVSGRGKRIGSENGRWKGGIQIRDPDRGRYQAKVWIKAVKDRDGWKCAECGSVELLHAHHIKRWKDYPALRYEVSNGITLCHSCHEAAHGRGFKFRFKHAEISKSARTSQEV